MDTEIPKIQETFATFTLKFLYFTIPELLQHRYSIYVFLSPLKGKRDRDSMSQGT